MASVLWPERLRNSGRCLSDYSKHSAWSSFSRQKFTFFIAKMNRDDLDDLCGLIQAGKVTPVIDRRYPVD
jgi:hypothetical protein